MKRGALTALSAILLLGTLQFASAYDFGLTLDNKSNLSFDSSLSGTSLSQEDTLAAWFSANLGANTTLYAQGSYQFTLDRYYLFDIDQLYVDTTQTNPLGYNGKFTLRAGRIQDSDMSGKVLNGRLDGLKFELAYPREDVSMTFGYTGLMLKPTSTVVMSQMDNQDLGNSNILLGPPRLVAQTTVRFPNFVGFQTLSFDFIAQFDLRSSKSVVPVGQITSVGNSGGLLDTQYLGMKLNGPITPRLFYNVFSYLNTGSTLSYVLDTSSGTGSSYQYRAIMAYAGGGSIDLYPAFLKSHFGLEGVYSTGDGDATSYLEGNTSGAYTSFIPINQDTTYALIFVPQLGNSARVGANFSLKPFFTSESELLRTFQLELKSYAFFRPIAAQPVSGAGVQTGVGGPYLGTEIDAYVRSRPFSDLGLQISVGTFIPNSGAGRPFPSGEPVSFQAGLEAIMSF